MRAAREFRFRVRGSSDRPEVRGLLVMKPLLDVMGARIGDTLAVRRSPRGAFVLCAPRGGWWTQRFFGVRRVGSRRVPDVDAVVCRSFMERVFGPLAVGDRFSVRVVRRAKRGRA